MSRNALHLTEAELLDLTARRGKQRTLMEIRDQPVEKTARKGKYGNTKCQVGELQFDSKAEARRWEYLVMLERAGEISELRRQVPFELIPATPRPSGGKERPTVYLADMTYKDKSGAVVVEDVKGAVTPEFRLKRKLMLWVHGIEIQEIRS